MNSAFFTTGIVALVTAVIAAAAAYFYPWPVPQIQNAKVNENLIAEYSTDDVAAIEIEKYDLESESITSFELTRDRRNSRWTIPQSGNFPAGNIEFISAVTSSLRDLKVHDVSSEEANDQIRYGVAEPDSDGVSGKGIRLSLDDKKGNSIATLIVGNSPENQPEKRFVRIPGQPQIYIVDFDAKILSTDFTDWIDTNLMRLPRSQRASENLRFIEIEKYLIDPTKLRSTATRQYLYKARIEPSNGKLKATIWKSDSDGKLPDEPTYTDVDVDSQWLARFDLVQVNTRFAGIKRKQDLIAQQMVSPTDSANPIEFSSMINNGFKHSGFEDGRHQFDSVGGKVTICKANGVTQTIYVGGLADIGQSGGDELMRYGLLSASVDESFYPEPEKPENADEDQERKFKAAQKKRSEDLAAAETSANDFNRFHADWYYVITESDVNVYSPSLEELAPKLK